MFSALCFLQRWCEPALKQCWKAKYVIKNPLWLEHDEHEGVARTGSETNKLLSAGGEIERQNVSGEMCTVRNENEKKKEKFVSRRDKINDDEYFKLKLSTSVNAHILSVMNLLLWCMK